MVNVIISWWLDLVPSAVRTPILYVIPLAAIFIMYLWLSRWFIRKLDAALSKPIKKIGMDIGGSLAKLVYFEPNPSLRESQEVSHEVGEDDELKERVQGGRLRFLKFEVRKLDELIEFMKKNQLHMRNEAIHVTGGGAHKYAKLFEERLGVKFEKEDEMHCLIMGLNFLLKNIPEESFTFSPDPTVPSPKTYVSHTDNPFPYLLVNVGSGVSMVRVDNESSYERVNGTAVGGGTFWGLCHLLTGVSDFDEMLELSKNGHADKVDLLVGDIYGTDYGKVGLSASTTASSFGKILYKDRKLTREEIKPEDIAIALLRMIANNIGQIAYLTALHHGIKRVYFGGFFLRNHAETLSKISFAIDYWSKGVMKAHFLTHEGYLGAMGALIIENKTVYEKSREFLELKKKEWNDFWKRWPSASHGHGNGNGHGNTNAATASGNTDKDGARGRSPVVSHVKTM